MKLMIQMRNLLISDLATVPYLCLILLPPPYKSVPSWQCIPRSVPSVMLPFHTTGVFIIITSPTSMPEMEMGQPPPPSHKNTPHHGTMKEGPQLTTIFCSPHALMCC